MKTLLKTLLVAVLFSAVQIASAIDVDNYLAAKGQGFVQTNDAAPILILTNEPFQAHASVTPTIPGLVTGAVLRLPSGTLITLEPDGDGSFTTDASFTTKAQLDSLIPAGTYTFTIFTVNDGTNRPTLTIPADAYPPTPRILNWLDAQEVDKSQPFTLFWSPFTNGTANDFIMFEIEEVNGGTVVSTPFLLEPGALNGTNSFAEIPANSLSTNRTYEGRLLFVKRTSLNTNAIPGAFGIAGYFKETVFPLTTLPEPPPGGRIQFSARGYAVNENEGTATVSVTRSGGESNSVNVSVAAIPVTATDGVDYVGINTPITFAAGISSLNVAIALTDDFRVESNETFTVTLFNPTGGAVVGSRSNSVVTILDNEKSTAGTLQFSPATLTISEAGPVATLTVQRLGGSAGTVSVDFRTLGGTAQSAADFVATNSTLTFAAAQISKTITVPILNDSLDETNETFSVVLETPTGSAALGSNVTATVTLTDNDDGGIIAFRFASLVTNENAGFALITLGRTAAAGQSAASAAAVNFATENGTATAGSDYTATNGTLVFASNELSKTFLVALTDDTLAEADETILLRLTNPTGGARLGAISNATLTLRDDESSVRFTNATYTVTEAGPSIAINVIRSGALITPVSVNYSTADGSALSTNDYRGTNGILNFPVNTPVRTITIPIANDTLVDSNETFSVFLHSPSNGLQLGVLTNTTVLIAENDAGGVLSFSATNYTTPEAGPATAITISRTGGTASGVSVWFSTADGSAAAPADYTALSNKLTFNSGELSKTVTVPVLNDALDETNETVLLLLSNVEGGATLGRANATLTLTDNDDGGIIAFRSASLVTNENAGFALITLGRTAAAGQSAASAAAVNFATENGTATAGSDYAATNGTLIFASNELSKTFLVALTDDTLAEADETILLRLTNPTGGARLGAISNATLTLRDDESSVRFTNATYTVTEAGPSIAINVIRSGALITPVSVNYSTADGSALSTNDYRGTNGTLSFPVNTPVRTITIPIANDTLVDSNETFSVFLHSPSNGLQLGVLTNTTVLIAENDAGGVLSFSAANYTTPEAGPATAITISRTGGTASGVSVWFSTADGSAAAPADYTAQSNKLTFNSGELSKTVTVPVLNDALDETNETVLLLLSNVEGGATLGRANATLTLTDNDDGGIIAFRSASLVTNENAGFALITLGRTAAAGQSAASAAAVNFATENGTATAGSDYTATNGTLVFASNELSKTFLVALTDDTLAEADETILLRLTNPTGGARLGAISNATLTLRDDESSVRFTNATYTVTEAGPSIAINVIRSGALITPVSVNYSTADGSALSTNDYRGTNGTLSFPVNTPVRTITIPIANDTLVDSNETFSVFLHSPSNGLQLGVLTNTTVLIAENDAGGVLSFSATNYTTPEAGPATVITISRTGGTASGVSVWFSTADGSAAAPADYTALSNKLTFNSGELSKTVTVPVLNDALDETNETVLLLLSNVEGGATLGRANATLTLTDNDTAGSIALSSASYVTNENNAAFHITITRGTSGGASGVTVDFTTRDGVAQAGSDYVATNGTLVFASNEVSKVLSVPVLNDLVAEGNETFSFHLSGPTGGATLGALSNATLTLRDDESSVSFTNVTYTVGEAGPSIAISVVRSGALISPVSVDLTTINGSAVSPADYRGTNVTLNFPAGASVQTVVIPIVNDTVDENDETFTARLSNPLGGVQLGTITNTVVTITDNDTAGSVQFGSAAYNVTEATNNAPIRVTRTGGLAGGVTVRFMTTTGTATPGADYTATTNTVTFNAGESNKVVLVPILADGVTEPNENVNLVLTEAAGGATLGAPNGAILTITDAPDVNAVPLAGAPFFNVTITGTNLAFNRTMNVAAWGISASGGSVMFYTNWASGNIASIYVQKDTETSTRYVSDTLVFSDFQIDGTGSRSKGPASSGTIYYDFYDETDTDVTFYTAEWESGVVKIDGMSVDGGGDLTGVSGRMDIIVKNVGSNERFRIVGSFRTKP